MKCTLANFIVGQAKLAIWKTRRMAAEGHNVDMLKHLIGDVICFMLFVIYVVFLALLVLKCFKS